MGFPPLTIACTLIALSSQGKPIAPQYRLQFPARAAEATFADPKLLTQNAELLLAGAAGERALIKEARSKAPLRAQAARLMMLGSAEGKYLPILLEELGEDSPSRAVADKAITLYPKAAWPILQRLAQQGHPGAFAAIRNYATLGEPELIQLARHTSPTVRAEAILNVEDKATLLAAVEDHAERVQRNAVSRLMNGGEVDTKPLLHHRNPHIRALAAEFTSPWTDKDFPDWIRLASDPSPQVRRWAVLQLAPLGVEWGHGPWTTAGIDAVGRAMKEGPETVRAHAVLAARSWILDWPEIHTRWTPDQIRRARAIFRFPEFRNAVYTQARHERQWSGSVDILGIQAAPAFEALALSGDRRTLAVSRRGIGREPWNRIEWIKALRYLPGPRTVDYLFDLIDLTTRRPAPPENNMQDYEADQVFGFSAEVLRALGVHNYSRVIAHIDNPRLAPAFRSSLAQSFGYADSLPLFQSVERLIQNESLPALARTQAINGLRGSPRPEADSLLTKLARESTVETIRLTAQNTLRERRQKKGQSVP